MRRVPLDRGVRWLLQITSKCFEFSLKRHYTRPCILPHRFKPTTFCVEESNITLLFQRKDKRAVSAKVPVPNNLAKILNKGIVV